MSTKWEIFLMMCPLFPSDYFHIGGDENNGKRMECKSCSPGNLRVKIK
jgi:N-acetyl-beta-hexosaminidase